MANPATPGEILLNDRLEPMGCSHTAMARAIGVAPRAIIECIRAQRAVRQPS